MIWLILCLRICLLVLVAIGDCWALVVASCVGVMVVFCLFVVVAAYAVWCLWSWCYCDLVCLLLLLTICFLDVLILIVLLLELVCMVFRCFVVALFGGWVVLLLMFALPIAG